MVAGCKVGTSVFTLRMRGGDPGQGIRGPVVCSVALDPRTMEDLQIPFSPCPQYQQLLLRGACPNRLLLLGSLSPSRAEPPGRCTSLLFTSCVALGELFMSLSLHLFIRNSNKAPNSCHIVQTEGNTK